MLPIRPGVAVEEQAFRPSVSVVLEPGSAPHEMPVPPAAMDIAVSYAGIAALSPAHAAVRTADVLIVEIDPGNAVIFGLFAAIARDNADRLTVIAAVRDLTVGAMRRLLRAGATDVLPLPFTADELAAAASGLREPVPLVRVPRAPQRKGKVIAVLGALGGGGATTVATQTGLIWAADARVCVVDLDIQFGNAALHLNLKPQLSLADVIEAGDRLDAELLQSIAERHTSGLSLVASPPEMAPLDLISTVVIDKMLMLATQVFDIVIVDLPRVWVDWGLRTLQLSDTVLLVTALSVPGIHQARRQLEVLEANGLIDRVHVVLNRVAAPLFGKVDLGETQSLLGRRIDFTVANDYPTVSAAIDEGKPLGGIKSRSRVEKDMRAIVASLSAALTRQTAA